MLKQELVKILESVGVKTSPDVIEIPPQEEFGDLAFPCFEVAKQEKKNPQKIAEELAKKIQISKYPLLLKVEVRGGYINFFLYWERIVERILKSILGKKKVEGKKKRIMVEYSQPNPVHPMHIGHARSTILGESVANIYEYLGYKTIRANYMNDIGLQVAKLVTAYLLWGKNKRPKGKPDVWLWQYYVRFHEEALKDTSLEEKARETLRKYEIENDKEIKRIWKKIIRWCINGFKETYKKLGIRFNVYFFESDFRRLGKEIVNKALMKNIAFKSPENTIVANLESYDIPSTVLLRSDGTGLYITSDLGLTMHKFEKYKLDKSIWVVMSQQNLHFKQLFKILELLEYPWTKNCYHFSYEPVQLAEGKMSGREGRAIMLDEVISELIRLSYDEVNKRNPKLTRKEKLKIAKKVGISALKYAILKVEPENTITFDWKQMLKLEGNTAPYLQYAHTRCAGILRKARAFNREYVKLNLTNEEKRLLKTLMNFSDIVDQASKNLKPHYICNYAYELATILNIFYQTSPVLKASGKERNFRLTLVEATKTVLKDALSLIGIEPLEKM